MNHPQSQTAPVSRPEKPAGTFEFLEIQMTGDEFEAYLASASSCLPEQLLPAGESRHDS